MGAVALTVVTLGTTTPLAVVAIGAAVGASGSTTFYTVSHGDKATIIRTAGATVTRAIVGAAGGGAGVVSGAIGGSFGTVVGAAIARGGSVGGDLAGRYFESSVGGGQFEVNGRDLLVDFFGWRAHLRCRKQVG